MNEADKLWDRLTPSQRLWLQVFGVTELPSFDQKKVMPIIESLPDREKTVVKLKLGFEGEPLTFRQIGMRLNRADGKDITGVSKEIARQEFKRAMRRLRNPAWHQVWKEAKLSNG